MKKHRIGFSLFFAVLLASFPLPAQTPAPASKFASYEDFVADHVKSKLFTIGHEAKYKMTKIKRDGLDDEMLLRYSPNNVGDNSFKENLQVFALIPDHPSIKNPPLAFLVFWDSTESNPRYADCKAVAVTINGQDLGDLPSEYKKYDNASGDHNEFITVTLNGQQLLDMAKADAVHVAVCTDDFDLTQEQRWTLRWVSENFLEILKKKMK